MSSEAQPKVEKEGSGKKVGAERRAGALKVKKLLSKRRDKPEFIRYTSYKRSKLRESWRRPRGMHNKIRGHIVAKGARVQAGYGRSKALRGFHPSGYMERVVYNAGGVDFVGKGEAIKVASGVGMKKRLEIEEKAAGFGIRVLNPAKRG
jgi:large subunit ribosomal protein L32e